MDSHELAPAERLPLDPDKVHAVVVPGSKAGLIPHWESLRGGSFVAQFVSDAARALSGHGGDRDARAGSMRLGAAIAACIANQAADSPLPPLSPFALPEMLRQYDRPGAQGVIDYDQLAEDAVTKLAAEADLNAAVTAAIPTVPEITHREDALIGAGLVVIGTQHALRTNGELPPHMSA
jgi:hypothetical protein